MPDKKPSIRGRDPERIAKKQDPSSGRETTDHQSLEGDIEITRGVLEGDPSETCNGPSKDQPSRHAIPEPTLKEVPQDRSRPAESTEKLPAEPGTDELSDMFNTLASIHEGVDRKHISLIGDKWKANQRVGIWPTEGEDDETFVLLPPPCKLPPHLMPWVVTLDAWEDSTHKALNRQRLPDSMKKTSLWKLSGPILPKDAAAWIITLGVDAGPQKGNEGFTIPLLVATPFEWFPKPGEVIFYGTKREVLVHRCDGISMQIPRDWWEKWAFGAMATGALYFTI